MTPKIAVITGPTATGKTALAVSLAKITGGEVVGADSMQIYKYMDIGTAKPSREEMQGIPHHMIDIVSPFESYSVSRYKAEASLAVDDILSRGKLPIVAGGTGLYIEALLNGTEFAPSTENGNQNIRAELEAMYDSLGGEKMLSLLSEFDEISAGKLASADRKRIVRAFEVYKISGVPISRHNDETKKRPAKYDCVKIALNFANRSDLYSRINDRVDKMFTLGLMEEVQRLLSMGISEKNTCMQAIGYKEAALCLKGDISENDAREDIKRASRRYAKRQISWIKRDENVNWINWDSIPDFEVGVRDSTKYLYDAGVI